jgi:hypothetical protein
MEGKMARDKAKDDSLFNCGQDWELKYVASHYSDKDKVYNFLKKKCGSDEIYHFTHKQVYELIKKELGYSIPV